MIPYLSDDLPDDLLPRLFLNQGTWSSHIDHASMQMTCRRLRDFSFSLTGQKTHLAIRQKRHYQHSSASLPSQSLSHCSALVSLQITGTNLSAQPLDLDALVHVTKLTKLGLSYCTLRNLHFLSSLGALQCLSLSGCFGISDLTLLSGLTALQSLEIHSGDMSNLPPLSTITQLRCSSSDSIRDLNQILPSGLLRLKSLECDSLWVKSLRSLTGPADLRHLVINNCRQVSDLSPLTALTALTFLRCQGTKVSDLGPLSTLTALESLYCQDTPVSDLRPLSTLTALESLYCQDTHVSDLRPLRALHSLRILNCSDTRVAYLNPLSNLTGLKRLISSVWPSASAEVGGLQLKDLPELDVDFSSREYTSFLQQL